MDRLESLGNALSQVTMYDIKSVYNQAKNMVLNVSEMEAKVREATNDDPWGASSTLMQEIAAGTHNFQQFNEIMPCIYSRFMDKEARQWREIYKALQLLEYIVKHGSERVVDDARSHLSTIKMLRNFHYIDEKGKDQGINVRNRAKELTELLMDVDRIRAERRKAKANRNKYIGQGNDPMSYTGGRYGGFGNDSYGGSRSYGGGGYDRDYGGYGGGGSSSSGFRDERRFDEYNAGDDEISAPRRSNSLATSSGSGTGATSTSTRQASKQPASKAQEKVVDLLGFGDDDDFSTATSASIPAPSSTGKAAEKALPSNPLDDGDDEFAEFQTAPSSAPVSPAPSATPAKPSGNIFDALGSVPLAASQPPVQAAVQPQLQQQQKPMQAIPLQGNYGAAMSPTANRSSFVTSPPMSPNVFGGSGSGVMTPMSASSTGTGPMGTRPGAQTAGSFGSVSTTAKAATGTAASSARPGSSAAGGFDDLWNMSLGTNKTGNNNASGSGSKSIKDLEKEKAQASIWGGMGQGQQQRPGATGSSMGLGSTGLGSSSTGAGTGGSAGGDDLLL